MQLQKAASSIHQVKRQMLCEKAMDTSVQVKPAKGQAQTRAEHKAPASAFYTRHSR